MFNKCIIGKILSSSEESWRDVDEELYLHLA